MSQNLKVFMWSTCAATYAVMCIFTFSALVVQCVSECFDWNQFTACAIGIMSTASLAMAVFCTNKAWEEYYK